jgi:hypothetical protein
MTEQPVSPDQQPEPIETQPLSIGGPIQGFSPIKFRPFPPPAPQVEPVVASRLKELAKHPSKKVRDKAKLVLGLVDEKGKEDK